MIPHHDLDSSMRELFGDISLADPAFYKSSPIDVLFGVDLTLSLLKGQTLSLGKDKPFAIRSELGWIIGGKANSSGQNSFHVNHIQLVSDQLINKFWKLDSVPCAKPLTSSEEACEDHFVKTHSRDENGRYTVRLPFHTPTTWLGNSKQNAIRRLISVERRPISNPDKYKLYRNFMKEYLDLKHMCVCVCVWNLFRTLKLIMLKVYTFLTMELLGTPAVQQSFASSLTPPVKLRLNYLSMICSCSRGRLRLAKNSLEGFSNRTYKGISPNNSYVHGTSSAPFLSTRTLRPLAIDEQGNYPAASRATLSHFYVDDLLSGSATKKGAIQLVSELQEMMKRGGFSLRKLVSNDPDVLATIPEELKAVDSKHTIKDDQPVKILGIALLPDVDKFTFTITVNETDVWTKRKVLSEVAKIFDPLVKTQSLPRLELCSALLLANLLQDTLPTLTLLISETFAWSDSKITLAWLKSEPRRWQPFVANRVAQIQELTPNVHWNFVSGLENPAECRTRGIPPTKLEKCNLWFNGPDCLRSSTFPIGEFEDNPQLQEHMSAEAKRTSKLIMLNVVDATFKAEFFQKFSSWNKLKRVVAYCLRFVKNCSLSACKRRKSFSFKTRLDNMLTKYQMIKFIDFGEVWFLPESVARVAAIVEDHRCHTPRH
ncbi:integrase catalytic domain-containing protein [Trichonephila clavipes]|nr:integrase catalytic domain-containing protein [Trichonephila clavipes]